MSLFDEMVELRRVSSIIKVDNSRGKVTLAGLPSFEHLVEKRWSIALRISRFRPFFGLLDISICGPASKLRGLLELLLKVVSLLDVLREFGIPFLNVVVVKTWRVRHGVHSFLIIFSFLVFVSSLSLQSVKWVSSFVRDSQGVDERKIEELVSVLPAKS